MTSALVVTGMPASTAWTMLFLWPLAAYALGGIPWGFLLVRWIEGIDLRSVGSGNIGATNAARALGGGRRGLALFLVVYLLDLGKALAVLLPLTLLPEPAPDLAWIMPILFVTSGAAAILGHCFSPWLCFKGGKGVATACGVLLALDWRLLLLGLACFFLVLLAIRIVSVGSMAMGLALPVFWLALPGPSLGPGGQTAGLLFLLALACLILWSHRKNLGRLLAGTEPRVRLGRRRETAGGGGA